MSGQLVDFEVVVTALDKPTDRKHHTGAPMHSKEASDALRVAVEAFQGALRDAGFQIGHTGYGVKWAGPVDG